MKFTRILLVAILFLTSFITTNTAEASCRPTQGPLLKKYLMLRGPYNEDAFKTYTDANKSLYLNKLFSKQAKIEAQIWLSNVIGCENISLDFKLQQYNGGKVAKTSTLEFADNLTASPDYDTAKNAYIKEEDIEINLQDICTGSGATKDCSLEFELDTGTSEGFNSRKQEGEYGYFKFQCTGDQCNQSIPVSLIAHIRNDGASFEECKLDEDDVSFTKLTTDRTDAYINNNIVQLNLKTKGNCINNHPLEISIWEEDTGPDDKINIEYDEFAKSNKILIRPVDTEDLYINFKTTESECDAGEGWNCYYYVEVKSIKKDDPIDILSTKALFDLDTESESFKNNINYKKGVILGDCVNKEKCNASSKWKILKTNGTAEARLPNQIIASKPTYDYESPCYREDLNPNEVGKQQGYDKDCYELLAPILGIGNPHIINGKETGRFAIQKISDFKFGDYFNKLFQLAIGILMIISIIMIVVAGVEYMTVESIYGKSNAKSRITHALMGLILGLGIYVILETINPKLLIVDFEKNIETVAIEGGGIGMDLGSLPKRSGNDPRSIDATWAQNNAPSMTFKTADGKTITVKACDTANMETYTAFGKKVTTRKELKPTIFKISEEWSKMGANKYAVNSLGGYSCRTISTVGSNAKKISTHAYGVTLDFNPTKNPYILNIPSEVWGDVSTYSDMPKSFRDLFTSKGFGWGGNWNNIKDAMHFSKASGNEQGDGTFQDF